MQEFSISRETKKKNELSVRNTGPTKKVLHDSVISKMLQNLEEEEMLMSMKP